MAFCAAVEAQLEQSMSAALGTSGQGPMGKAEPAGVGNRQLLRSVGSRACQEVNEICCNLSKKSNCLSSRYSNYRQKLVLRYP